VLRAFGAALPAAFALPLDAPNRPNVTCTVTKPLGAGGQIGGFMTTTRVSTTVLGECSAQVICQLPAIPGAAPGAPFSGANASTRALIGAIPAPSLIRRRSSAALWKRRRSRPQSLSRSKLHG
jgi:hypothetical protein